VVAVVARELRRFLRQRSRLLSTFARPLLWLIVFGAGLGRIVPNEGTVSYKQFMLPGIYGMVLLFSTMLSALATVHDREFGPIRMLLVAPLPRSTAVVAKTVSATVLGIVQVLLMLPLVWILGLSPSVLDLLGFGGALLVSALALASVGMVVASSLRSIENFAAIMNFVMFPMLFLSGALYPAASLPGGLQPFVSLNPLTYAIDLLRHPLLAGLHPGNLGADHAAGFDIGVLVAVSAVLFALASLLFGEEHHLGRILLRNEPRRSRPWFRWPLARRSRA
jgi:ABC-2 type transport system permease protein